MHLVVKHSYGDFDIAITTPVAVSENATVARTEAAVLNAQRNAKDRAAEIEYDVISVRSLDK